MTSLALVHTLVSAAERPTIGSTADLRAHVAAAGPDNTVERAALGGLCADGLGWAFACGYEAALRRLPGAGVEGRLACLAATEEGGGHPRAIRAALTPREPREPHDRGGWELSGDKAWVTLGTDAEVLLVVATTGQDDRGRNRLRVARVPSSRAGVTLQPGAPRPFVPEIAHARLQLRCVLVADDELLEGDGYDDVLKPFRTIEDTHVFAACLGWALGVGQASGWDHNWIERALATLVALRGIGQASPSAPETHLALAGAMELGRSLLTTADWWRAHEAVRARWERDRPLLEVAGKVRAARLEAAWGAVWADKA
jgi:alkylation response protein AidB-like acyl-CoA dehydrogenase